MTDLHERAAELLAKCEGMTEGPWFPLGLAKTALPEALALIRDFQADRDAAIQAAVEKEREACIDAIHFEASPAHNAVGEIADAERATVEVAIRAIRALAEKGGE